MILQTDETIIDHFYSFIENDSFPCVGAKRALVKKNIHVMLANRFDSSDGDNDILKYAYNFIGKYRENGEGLHSMAIIFKDRSVMDEARFEKLMWRRLQSLRDIDAAEFGYDTRVSADPLSPSFSFSIGEEAFFIVALHPSSSRQGRRFSYPTLVFNPHSQFEKMRENGTYSRMREVNRERDIKLSGSINPMLRDYGEASEIFQYSGARHDAEWKCPFKKTNI
ncbi:MAG: guanitoxin biosynthesis heme-dependent pre-guanitoxin N-hydroxylase GntA [Ginsengibacter sp.]